MVDFRDNPNHKGNVAEAMIYARAIQLGLDVLLPAGEHSRYDMAFDLEGIG
ncbi:MAG: group I intron-associated PD-(D/E)XK endonuclease, partial [Solirubrobacterales bacterium]